MPDKPTVYVQDAAIDEYMASVLLTTMPGYALAANVIVDADCIGGPAMQTAWKLNQFLGVSVPLGLSAARAVNAFPWEYRQDCVQEGQTPSLRDYPVNPDWPWYPQADEAPGPPAIRVSGDTPAGYPDGDALLAGALDQALAADQPLTLVVNCPMTPVQTALAERPEREHAIERAIWMGGAVDLIRGNLDPDTLPAQVANPFAEWNVFFDPCAVDWVFRNTHFPIVMYPLNVTNQAKITGGFMATLAAQSAEFRYSKLAFESYSLVSDQPFYCMWDVVSVCYLTRPELFEPLRTMQLGVVTQGYYQGTLIEAPYGRRLQVVMNIADKAGFYEYVAGQLRR